MGQYLGWIILGAIVLFAIYGVTVYNGLVTLRQRCRQAFSDIDVQLRQRHDLVPNLVETVKGYASHERETLDAVVRARNAAVAAHGPAAQAQAEGQLQSALRQLFALAEAYPDLKANTQFQHLQQRITELENGIADRREYYNESVNLNNVRIEQFPDVLIARRFGFGPFELLEFSEEEKADVDIRGLFERS